MGSAVNMVGKPRLERSHYNLRYRKLFNCDMGQLIPVQVDMILPGDTFRLSHDIVTRMQPLVAPILQEINVDTHTFFVPMRIIDPGWEESSSGGEDGETTVGFPVWVPETNPPVKYSLWDYMGHPLTQIEAPWPTNWHKQAYNLVWNEYYRDENLQDEVDIDISEEILYRAFRKDYFTSALKETQRGNALAMPIAGSVSAMFEGLLPLYQDIISRITSKTAGVTYARNIGDIEEPIQLQRRSMIGVGTYPQSFQNGNILSAYAGYNGTLSGGAVIQAPQSFMTAGTDANIQFNASNDQIVSKLYSRLDDSFRAWLNDNTIDLSTATTFDVNDLRTVVAMQKFMERNARIGVRYTEQLQGRWRTSPRDERLQRPEYIGGTRSPVIVSEVLQTSQTTAGAGGSPQGNLAGHGLSANVAHTRRYRAQEWGILITMLSIMPKVGYSQGIDRQWLYESRWDLPAPEFAHLGEREIYNTEIYTSDDETQNRGTFGYRPQFDEHRLKQDMVCGDMRDVYNYWHLNREFDQLPLLNGEFISTKDNIRKDIFAVQDEPGFIMHVGNKLSITRSLPALGEPGLLDHF